MHVIHSGSPISASQKRFNRIVILLLPSLGALVGGWEALECSHIRFGYVASYAAAIALGGLALVVGLLSLIYWRTRKLGVALMGCGVLSIATFYGGIALLIKTDRVAWRHEPPMQRFGPDQSASVVIYFRHGVSDQQIEQFISDVLEEDARPRHDGRDYPAFVDSYLRLSPNQAHGFDACAITFRPESKKVETVEYVNRIIVEPRVAKVFRDVAPQKIDAPPSELDRKAAHQP